MKNKITSEKIEEIKQAIEVYEFDKNGMGRLNGTNVIVRNLKIRGTNAVADIVLEFEDRKESFNDLDYDIKLLRVEI